MSKVFGFLIALAMTTGMANAALLATWSFTNSDGTTVSAGSTAGGLGGVAGDFKNFGTPPGSTPSNGTPSYGINGSVLSNKWVTGDVFNPVDTDGGQKPIDVVDKSKGNTFSYTNNIGKFVIINEVKLTLNLVSPPNLVGSANALVFYSFDSGVTKTFIGAASTSSSTPQTVPISTSIFLDVGSSVDFFISYTGSGATSSFAPRNLKFQLDDLTLSGTDAIPEPASMACFVGLFAAGALRRLRKRA